MTEVIGTFYRLKAPGKAEECIYSQPHCPKCGGNWLPPKWHSGYGYVEGGKIMSAWNHTDGILATTCATCGFAMQLKPHDEATDD